MNIKKHLYELQDIEYRDFQAKLIPNLDIKRFIGVRTPELRKLAKSLAKEAEIADFLNGLPHEYFDENQLHAFIIAETKDFDICLAQVKSFLPYIDNWATCDQLSPKVFRNHKAELLVNIKEWIESDMTYMVRFAMGMLMQHFLDDDFKPEYPEMVAAAESVEYYINMMRAWYFATALAKQYEAVLPFLKERRLDKWTHNKTIQKAIESYRITDEQKGFLKTLRIKNSEN